MQLADRKKAGCCFANVCAATAASTASAVPVAAKVPRHRQGHCGNRREQAPERSKTIDDAPENVCSSDAAQPPSTCSKCDGEAYKRNIPVMFIKASNHL